MHQMSQFHSDEFGRLEILMIDGKPYFPATECARILGYSRPADAISAHCKGSVKHRVLSNGGYQEAKFIPEGDLYRLIIRSKLPAAERFERWVFDTVLPSIRKHGAYIIDEVLEEAAKNQDFAFELFRKLQAEKGKTTALLDKVEALAPKARYYDLILQSKGVVQVSIISKDYGMTAVAFNRLLHDLRIQYRVGSTWLLYKHLADQGYTKTRTYYTPGGYGVIHTYWTQKGRLFLYDTLKVAGILPLMETMDAADFAFGEAWQ